MNIKKIVLCVLICALILPLASLTTAAADDIRVEIDGVPVYFAGQPPISVEGRTLVPIRAVFEALGFRVSWDSATQTATLTRSGLTMVVTVGSSLFTVNGQSHPLDVPAQVIGGSTMLPLRALVAAAGYRVVWDGQSRIVMIVTNMPPPVPPLPPSFNTPALPSLEAHGLVLANIYGEDEPVLRFTETRHITVQAWNRDLLRMPHISESYWADWIRAEVLRLHNIDVTFVEVDRFNEGRDLGQLLAAGTAPDISHTFYSNLANTQSRIDGEDTINLAPLVRAYGELIPHMHELLGEDMIWWNYIAADDYMWAFSGRMFSADYRLATFVREDWLHTLGIAPPTSHAEFEAMLIAFRDNAELLLGDDAQHMIPFLPTSDIGRTAEHILTSFIPSDITHREWFVYGFDDRRFMYNFMRDGEMQEGVRLLNRWFNQGLLWRDFVVHSVDSLIFDDLIKLGFVGAFQREWNYPFRLQPGISRQLHANVGTHANFIAVAPFENDAGEVRMEVAQAQERYTFFPHTNQEPIASLLYLDFISRPDVREFLMFGYYGIHFETCSAGFYRPINSDDHPDNMLFSVIRNFDFLLLYSGVPELSNRDLFSLVFIFNDNTIQENSNHAAELTRAMAWRPPRVITSPVAFEVLGEGLHGPHGIGNVVLLHAIQAHPRYFEEILADGLERYLNVGGRAIIEGRRQVWYEAYGDSEWVR